jgi:hypothetical protein
MDLINTKNAKEVLKELKALKTTNGLTTQSLEMLASIGVKRVYKMNDCIWRTGDAGESGQTQIILKWMRVRGRALRSLAKILNVIEV